MALPYKVFHAVGVVVAEVKSDTIYSVMSATDIAGVDFTREDLRFTVDLSRTPKRAGVKAWSKVLVDDRGINKDGTEIPPTRKPQEYAIPVTGLGSGISDTPGMGAFAAGVYLEQSLFLALQPDYFPEWPGKVDLVPYTSIATLDGDAAGNPLVRRHHGFLATVKAVAGTKITLTSNDQPTVDVAIDLGNKAQYLLAPPKEALAGNPSLADNLVVGATGAIFFELQFAVGAGLKSRKIPVGLES